MIKKYLKMTMLLLFFFSFSFSFGQTAGIKISWNKEVGCQTYSQSEDPRDPKEPLFLEDILDTECVKVCEKSYVTYTLTNLPAGSTITWSAVGGTISGSSTSATCNVSWGNTGNGNLVFNIITPTGSITKTICIEKITLPIADFSIIPQNQNGENYLYGCLNQTVFFTNLSTANNGSDLVSYHWNFGDGTASEPSISAAFQPSHVYTNEDTYKVSLTVTNSCNCSTTYSHEIIIKGKGFDISCPSVVCEGEKQTYSLPFEGMEVCREKFNWSVIGGDILSEAGGNVEVIWNNVDASGFGYVTFDPKDCNLPCLIPTTIKIPVIQSQGTILGDAEVCYGNQGRYKLPQWPTTDFQWEIVGNVANNLAEVILTDQRNEVIITPHVDGVLTLRATYMNTLLECGGVAEFTINVTKPVIFEGDNILCKGTNSSFNTLSGILTNWTLTNAAGTVISTATNTSEFNYTYTTVGNYTISAGNSSSSSCPSMQKNISVLALPSAPTAVTGELIICPDAPYVYSINSPDPNANYIWTVTNGTPQGSNIGNQITVIFNDNTNPYGISVVKQSINPVICYSLPLNLTITKKVIPAIIKTASNTAVINVCANSTSQYKAFNTVTSSVYNEGESYTWSIIPSTAGSITTGQGTNAVSVLWNNTSSIVNATLQLVIKKCTITQSFISPLQIIPPPQIIITANDSVCSGTPLTFTVSSINGVSLTGATVTWDFNGTVVTTGVGVISAPYTFTNTTNANNGVIVSAYVTGASGCSVNSAPANKSVTILPAPPASLSLTSNNGNVFCDVNDIVVTLTAATSATGVTYKWFKDGAVISGTNPVLNVGSALGFGTYHVRITNTNECYTDSNSINIVQNCGSLPGCTINPYPTVQNNAVNNCGIITLTGTASPTPLSASWDIFGPVNYSSYTGSTIVPNRAGDYNIFYKPTYTCTNGLTGAVSVLKKVTIPYIANFAYKTTCAGNNTFTVTFTDKSEFFEPVGNRSVIFSYKLSSASTFTNVVGNTVTLTAAGSYDFKVTINGTLGVNAQPTCEKITPNILINGVPNRSITINAINCHDTPVTFNFGSLPSGETVLWELDNATVTSTVATPTRVFDAPGNYWVKATVTNNIGCSKEFKINITIPPACFSGVLTATPSTATVCQGQSVTITYTAPVSNNCPVNQYVWMNGTTAVFPPVNSNTLQVSIPGFYWLKIYSAGGCEYNTPNRITPVFKTPPSIKLKGEGTLCENGTLVVQAITTSTTISWFIDGYNDGTNTGLTQINVNGLSIGTHTISATVTQNGCSKTATHTVIVYGAPPTPTVSFNLESCNPYKYKLTATVPGNASINWSNGQPSTVTFAGGNTSSTIYVTEGGPYSATATIGNCSSTAQLDVPKNPENFIWIFPSGCFDNCKNDVANLIGPRASFKYWAWSFDNVVEQSGNDTFVAPYQIHHSGAYNLTLVSDECKVTSAPLHYTEQTCDICKIAKGSGVKRIIENEETPYCDFNVLLSIISGYTTTQNFVLLSPNQDFVIVPSSLPLLAGPNNAWVQIIPLNGFSGATQLILETTINGEICQTIIPITIPSCAVNNNSRTQVAEETIVSTDKISLYPNPAKELVTLQFANATKNATVTVYNLLGTKMDSFSTTEQTAYTIDTRQYSAGMYIVVVATANGTTQQFKLIKE
ncbi:T9SS type A sorting domain-containing protein [Flavobacterium sp. F372]|uniref:T9SS type A sorting domain-containing protein n=1 Tax=Flavobacterium bernardetii TaxID=2813823 RepID=A0ABR7J2B0_9FLAO|nr:PKD domain-containing protein [Flavobacterium bernardetii]MBC5836226.1 T9SS type A sorting domain-containing protein [Flavobacterium bernardetii]NHF71463.1 T9SS type A sorting domain-containing protein [Flavobacterium bernardetii]